MNPHRGEPKPFFLSPGGNIYADTLICSGTLAAEPTKLVPQNDLDTYLTPQPPH